MKYTIFIYIFPVLFAFQSQKAQAQSYSLAIKESSFTLDGTKFKGYATDFVQPFKEVKKEWWRYVNARTVIFNHKTYFELTIPAQGKEANTPLKFVSQLTQPKDKSTSTLRMALITEDIPEDQISNLSVKARHLLKDFKVSYFTQIIGDKIGSEEAHAKKISMEMDKFLLDNSKLQQWIEKKPEEKGKFSKKLTANTKEVEKLQNQLNISQSKLAKLKKELTLIK